jgi:hypothetical protein
MFSLKRAGHGAEVTSRSEAKDGAGAPCPHGATKETQ